MEPFGLTIEVVLRLEGDGSSFRKSFVSVFSQAL